MKDLSELIIEQGLVQQGTFKLRETVRAIIINQKKEILLVYSSLFDDYTFPGGGIKEHESHEEALRRELKEEIGAEDLTIIKPYGQIKELRYGVQGSNNVYLQTSYYYICEIQQFGEQQLMGRELNHGLSPAWVTLEEALKKNEEVLPNDLHQTKGLKTVLIRENRVLETLKEIIYA